MRETFKTLSKNYMESYTWADMQRMKKGSYERGFNDGQIEVLKDIAGMVSIIIIIGLMCIAFL